MSGTDFSAKFADNSVPAERRRGRPPSATRKIVRQLFPEARSERSVGNRVAALNVAAALAETDPGLHEWLYNELGRTAVYELGRCPIDSIASLAAQLGREGIIRAREAVQILRLIRRGSSRNNA